MYRDPPPDAPKSIFDIPNFARSDEEARKWLDSARFPDQGPLQLPDFQVVELVREKLESQAKEDGLQGVDILDGYEWLRQSAKSTDYVCGKQVPPNNLRCGGIMDIQVTASGLYYICRKNPKHIYQV